MGCLAGRRIFSPVKQSEGAQQRRGEGEVKANKRQENQGEKCIATGKAHKRLGSLVSKNNPGVSYLRGEMWDDKDLPRGYPGGIGLESIGKPRKTNLHMGLSGTA